MARIFISYAREDFKPVKELHQRLEGAGFIPWMDKVDLIAGKRWRPAIEQAIRKTDFFVICLSNHSVKKRSFVQREIKMAVDLWQEKLEDDVYLIPVLLEFVEPEEIPDKLREVGWVFLYEEDGWDELLRALKHGMEQRAIEAVPKNRREEELRILQEQLLREEERKAEERREREAKAREEEEKREVEKRRQREANTHQEEERRQREAKAQEEEKRRIEGRVKAEEQRQREAKAQQEGTRRQAEQRRLADEANEARLLAEQKRLQEEVRKRNAESARKREELRRHLFTLARPVGLGVLLLLVVVGLYWLWPHDDPQSTKQGVTASTPSISSPSLPSQTFTFETVKLDRSGKEISRENKQARYFTDDLGKGVTLDMVEIPSGSFTMGSNDYNNEKPPHLVAMPSFWMGKFEVTQKQWQALMGNNPSNFKGDDNRPVENVSWDDAQAFLKKLNDKLDLKDESKKYRLPSEAEWEYAARAGTTTPFAFGDTITPKIVNYDGNYPYPNAPKGEYRSETVAVSSLGVANAFGLFDMHGNVWEWCQDIYHVSYNDTPKDGRAWESGGTGNRVLRGGSWYHNGNVCRSSNRISNAAGYHSNRIGFRVVLSSRIQ